MKIRFIDGVSEINVKKGRMAPCEINALILILALNFTAQSAKLNAEKVTYIDVQFKLISCRNSSNKYSFQGLSGKK